MGDKNKLKTGNLGVNAMEEKRLNKYLNTLEKQSLDKVINTERQQKVLAKNFYNRLDKSAALAKKQENIAKDFRSNRCYLSKRRVEKNACIRNSTPDEPRVSEMRGSPSLLLREWNETFDVPYLKEYSFRWSPDTKPSSVLEMRCKMWQKIQEFCHGRERAHSAPPWSTDLRAPQQVQRAHIQALEVMGIQKTLVKPPSRQPLIDLQRVRRWREKENKVACCAVKEFAKTVVPYKLKPGPSQQVHDINSFYQLVSTSGPPFKSVCWSAKDL